MRRARDRALVPMAPSSQRPPGAKLTRSARRRMVGPPQVHRMVPVRSVTAVTNPASSAMARSSSARPSTGRRNGEPSQRRCTAPPSVTAPLSSAGSTLPSERSQDSVTSGRGAPSPDGLAPASLICGTQRDHALSSLAFRCRSSLRCAMCPSCRRTGTTGHRPRETHRRARRAPRADVCVIRLPGGKSKGATGPPAPGRAGVRRRAGRVPVPAREGARGYGGKAVSRTARDGGSRPCTHRPRGAPRSSSSATPPC